MCEVDMGEKGIPLLFIKVTEKKKYAREILDGNIYMKESGYFRKLEDGFRGDPYDGRRPIDIGNESVILENPETGERIELNDGITSFVKFMTAGFVGDDKVPVLCMFLLETDSMYQTEEGHYRLKKEYVNELRKFGEYAAVVSVDEMYKKIKKYNTRQVKKGKHRGILCAKVQYTDILKAYSMEDFEKTGYEQFFKKGLDYSFQNEWRAILVGKKSSVKKKKDHRRIRIGKFKHGGVINVEDLLEGEFVIGC